MKRVKGPRTIRFAHVRGRQGSRVKEKIKLLLVSIIIFSISVPLSYAKSGTGGVEKLFLEGKYGEAIYEADSLIDRDSVEKDELYYIKGLSLLKLKRFAEARQSFQHIISEYSDSKRMFDANLGMGDSYFLEGDKNEALKAYSQMLDKFRGNGNMLEVRQRMEDCSGGSGSETKMYSEERVNFMPKRAVHSYDGQRFAVQVGSFKSKTNADRLVRKLSSRGYESYLEAFSDDGAKVYRVKVGRFTSKEEAENIAVKLKKGGYPTKICADNI